MITHRGIISKVSKDTVSVAIKPDSNECGACAIASMCGKSEVIEVPYVGASPQLVGRSVVLGASSGLRRKAILLFFAVPILLLIGIMALCVGLQMAETTASLIAIAAVVVWYVVVYALRFSLRENASFSIISKDFD